MIEKVLNSVNMQRAYHQVKQNGGSAGVDGMNVKAMLTHWRKNREAMMLSIHNCKYIPQPILGVEIPKSNGKMRLLGIPSVTDRLLQQAVHQVIMPMFEVEFKPQSYGFRPKRNAQQAVQQSQAYINEGYQHIVDIDLKNFFDEVNHSLLLNLLHQKVKCQATLRLIRKWLRAPIQVKGKLIRRRKGVPQGSPLSPLLSNIMLHELDKELEKQGHRHVRYADDFSIYCKSKSSARKVGNSIFLFLKNKLKLPINREKSGIRKPVQFEILGYKFVPTYVKGERGKYQMVIGDKGWHNLKQKVKSATRKTSQHTFAERVTKLKEIQRGWLNYFRMASITGKLVSIDSWIRHRLRCCIWKNWKKAERRRKNLIRLGVNQLQAYRWSRTRMGTWAVAQSPMLKTTITLQRLRQRGYESLLEYYQQVAPQLNEPLYARPACTVV
jgi:RNA-directed DNA polymerase